MVMSLAFVGSYDISCYTQPLIPQLHLPPPPNNWSQSLLSPRVFISILLLGIFVISFIFTYAYFTYQQIYVGDAKPGSLLLSPSPIPSASPAPPIYTFVLLGHGDPGHEGGLLTDSIMVIKVDTGLQKIALISVPRDLWVSFPSHGWSEERYWKINAAYAIGSDDHSYAQKPTEFTGPAGGGELAKYSLKKILGFPIDYFMALNFTGFAKSIDVISGVEVFLPGSFEDPLYPIPGQENNPCGRSPEDIVALTATMSANQLEQERVFDCRYELLSFSRGMNHLDGEAALKYVRSRHAPQDGGDFNRARRQQQVLLAIKDKILKLNFIPKIIPFVSRLTANMKTDLSLFQMNELLQHTDQWQSYQIVNIALTNQPEGVLTLGISANGQSILIPKTGVNQWSEVHQWINQQLTATASTQKN